MPLVFPTCVVSFSSEDPNHPVSNLLNRDTFRKWKCKEPGEKEAFVILKFDKAMTFTGIDIGNEASAMVEVLVGRSGSAEIKYEVLLSSSVLMSPADSRNLNNPCGVRSYSASFFDRETASQKWDLVKIVVSQIFNKHTQFGLTFVKFTAAPDPDEPMKIGAFSLRKPLGLMDDDDDDSPPNRIGAMFAKSIANKNSSKGQGVDDTSAIRNSTSAAILEATKAISGASQLSSSEKVKDILKKPKLDVSSSGIPSSSSFKKQSYDPSQQNQVGSPSAGAFVKSKKEVDGKSDKLPSRNTLVDSPSFVKKKTNQNPNSPGQRSPKSFQTTTNKTSSGSTTGVEETKVNRQDRNGQLSISTNTSRKKESLGTGNNLSGRNNNKEQKLLPRSGDIDRKSTDENRRDSASTSKSSSTMRNASSTNTNKQTMKKHQRKPFGKLFEGVIFVMSGFENPYRRGLRDKAIEMGARCKPDWDSTCTHLICAFINTPKFQQVRAAGNGKIVKKDWIERSYVAKCRIPWRIFCLDRNDEGDASEEEIYAEEIGEESEEEEEIPENPFAEAGVSSNSYGNGEDYCKDENDEMDVDPDGEMDKEKEDEEISPTTKSRKRILTVDSDEENQAAYDADTDVDEKDPPNNSSGAKKSRNDVDSSGGSDTDFEEEEGSALATTARMNNDDERGSSSAATKGFFENSVFFLALPKGDPLIQRSQIEQIISKRKGRIESELSEDVEYFITSEKKWSEKFSEDLSDNPNLSFVHFDWILDCESKGKMTSCDPHMITPS